MLFGKFMQKIMIKKNEIEDFKYCRSNFCQKIYETLKQKSK